MSVLFVGGVHSVGKSTSCANISRILNIAHFSAGQIIREGREAHLTTDKQVADVSGNQNFLIRGMHEILKRHANVILDGHLTLMTTESKFEEVSCVVFEDLRISGIVVFTDAPDAIQKRRFERDGIMVDVSEINAHQEREVLHAKHVSEALNVPLLVLKAFADDEAALFLSQCISS